MNDDDLFPPGYHAISVAGLLDLLQDLHFNWTLVPNQVRNFAIHDYDNEYIGYIDLHNAEVIIFDRP